MPIEARGKKMLTEVTVALRRGVPAKLIELKELGRALHRRAADVLAYIRSARYIQRLHRGNKRATGASTRHRS